MKILIAILLMAASTCAAQKDTTEKKRQSILVASYDSYKHAPSLKLPKAQVVKAMVIIEIPRRPKKKKAPLFD